MALLSPVLLLAQCVNEDWYSATSILPSGGGIVSNQSTERFVVSELDGSVYQADILFAESDNTIDLVINNVSYQISDCGSEKVLMIHKFNQFGQFQWLKTGCFSNSGNIYGLAVDETGNIYVGGTFSGTWVFEGDTLYQPLPNSTGSGYFTIKINMDGELAWYRAGDRGAAIRHTWTDQGLLMLISLTDSITFNGQTYHKQDSVMPGTNEYLVLMVSESGDVIWDRHIAGLGLKSINLVSKTIGKCLVQGMYYQEITYDGQSFTNGSGTMFQIAINTVNGNRMWMKKQGGGLSTDIFAHGSEFLDDETVVTAGHYLGSPSIFTFQGQTISSLNGLTDVFIMRQNANTGELIWLKTLGAPGYSTVFGTAKTANGVAVAGYYDCPELNFEGLQLVNHSNNKDPFVIIVDRDGKPQCHFTSIGTADHDVVSSINSIGDDLYIMMPVIDSIAFGSFQFMSNGSDNVLWKTCLPCDTLTSITEPTTTNPTLHIYPNPASQSVQIEITGSHAQAMGITITDLLGHAVLSLPYAEVGGAINISNLANGIYTIAATMHSGETLRQRLVVQH